MAGAKRRRTGLFAADGRLLLNRPDSESTVSALLLANADGSDPAELFRTADVIRADMADSQWLYIERYAAEDDAAQNALYRLPLDGGEPEWLMDLEMGQNTSAGVIGCLGRELIYYSFDWGDDTVPPEAMNWTAEEWEAWDASQTGTHKVEAINVDTGGPGGSWRPGLPTGAAPVMPAPYLTVCCTARRTTPRATCLLPTLPPAASGR